jgi:co-chaperonin GroES (HSP10)
MSKPKPRIVRPLGDRIIVNPFDTVRSAIIHIPENAKGTPTRGIVVAVGKGVKEDIRIGQEVLVTMMGSDYDFGNGLVKVFDMHQVLAIIN